VTRTRLLALLTFVIPAAGAIGAAVDGRGGAVNGVLLGAVVFVATAVGFDVAPEWGRGQARFRQGPAVAGVRFRAAAPSAIPGAGMRMAAWLMPGASGQEWLAEALSIMFEAAPEVRRSIKRSYLLAAGQVLVVTWTAALTGRLRAVRDAKLPGGGR